MQSNIDLVPTILFITGLALWQRRRWAEARKKEAIRHHKAIAGYQLENVRDR